MKSARISVKNSNRCLVKILGTADDKKNRHFRH